MINECDHSDDEGKDKDDNEDVHVNANVGDDDKSKEEEETGRPRKQLPPSLPLRQQGRHNEVYNHSVPPTSSIDQITS